MDRRYVIIDRRKSGDEFIDILDSDITEADAIAKTEDSWAYLTPEEKKQSDMCLAYLAVDDGQLVSWDSDGYQGLGYDSRIYTYNHDGIRNAARICHL